MGGGWGYEFKGFQRGADFEAKIRGVNSVSGENLHDFEILAQLMFNVKPQRVIFPRYSALV